MNSFVLGKKLTFLLIILICIIGCGDSSSDSDAVESEPGALEAETHIISGIAQKGSIITIYELDDNFNQTGASFQTEIINDLGE